jgi:hypothetical protein
MKHTQGFGLLLLAVCSVTGSAAAESSSGRYVAVEEPGLVLTLKEAADGTISGSMADGSMSMSLSARRKGERLSGTVGSGEEALPFTGSIQGESVVLELGPPDFAERVAFKRAGGGSSASPAPAGQRHVVINGKRYSDSELAQVEQRYGIRIPDAEYWYDRTLGAWGAKGGPTMGFLAPGLDLGGALQADASGGTTRVFVNGRELDLYDLIALQKITGPIVPGRYFIDAQGLAGYEGGQPQWNLAAMAAQSGGGGSNTWQGRVTGSSGFSDGTTGAVFLPNGGIVSTGN